MGTRLNTEFNYRTQVIGHTPWEKIKTLKGFLVGRQRAAALEECNDLKRRAKHAELAHLKEIGALLHVILEKEADLIEFESHQADLAESFAVNRREIECLEKLLAELYAIAPRIEGHDDDMMFEANACNEFTAMIGKEIQAGIIANGRPSQASIGNALCCQETLSALQAAGLIPSDVKLLEASHDPRRIEFK